MTALMHKGPLGVREFHVAAACQQNKGHRHNHDHLTILGPGDWEIVFGEPVLDSAGNEVLDQNGNPTYRSEDRRKFNEGEAVTILAGLHHHIKFLGRTDGGKTSWYVCAFSHRDFNGVVVERYNALTCDPAAYE